MIKIAKTLGLFLILALVVTNSYSQFVVRVRPVRPARVIVRRPPPPSAAHIWVDEDWVAQNGAYVWHGGYYVAPPRHGAVYVPGHWRNTRRGSVWIPGRWR
jgi:hypothetical protein